LDALGILIFCVALVLSVMLHETGHFVTAKRFGMKCTQYFFGFGPTLWSVKRGETEYGFKAIPAGGFVKIVGMTSLDEVDPEDEPRSFRRAPGWQRVIVLAAGSFMHFLLAAVLIFGVALAIGVENVASSNTTQLGTVAPYVPANETALLNGTTCAGEAKSPAAAAGLKVGDQITSFDGVPVSNWTQLQNEILKVKPGTPVTLTALRGGHSLTLHTTVAEVKGHGSFFGISPVAATTFQRQNPLDAVKEVGTSFSQVVTGSASALGQVPAAVPSLFSKDRGCSAAGNVGSVIGAAQATGQAVAAPVGWQSKVSYVLLLIAELNIFWGVFNLLPLLPLDGGHIAVVFWERIRAWFARRRGRPDPGPVDYRRVVAPMFAVFSVIIVFTLVVILADIVNPVNFG
jgi:membrane-associated protease RseP (regulator of RpoE activity)